MKQERILLTGGTGQLGTELQKLRHFIAPNHKDWDLTDPKKVYAMMKHFRPTLIVHAAAYTDTGKPEKDEAAAAECYRTNVLGTRNLVEHAECPIIYISTENAVEPYNFYILTKIMGEVAIKGYKHDYKIVRTSFRDDPFEYEKAATDMLTIADTVPVIAALINQTIDLPCENNVVYVGTGVKTVYELAVQTRPDVIPATRAEISPILPAMEGLLNI